MVPSCVSRDLRDVDECLIGLQGEIEDRHVRVALTRAVGRVREAADLQRDRADRDALAHVGVAGRRGPAKRVRVRDVRRHGLRDDVAVRHAKPSGVAHRHADQVVGDGRVADVVGDEKGVRLWTDGLIAVQRHERLHRPRRSSGRTRPPCAPAEPTDKLRRGDAAVPSWSPREAIAKHGFWVALSTPSTLVSVQGPLKVTNSALFGYRRPPVGAPRLSTGKPFVDVTTRSNGGFVPLDTATTTVVLTSEISMSFESRSVVAVDVLVDADELHVRVLTAPLAGERGEAAALEAEAISTEPGRRRRSQIEAQERDVRLGLRHRGNREIQREIVDAEGHVRGDLRDRQPRVRLERRAREGDEVREPGASRRWRPRP